MGGWLEEAGPQKMAGGQMSKMKRRADGVDRQLEGAGVQKRAGG